MVVCIYKGEESSCPFLPSEDLLCTNMRLGLLGTYSWGGGVTTRRKMEGGEGELTMMRGEWSPSSPQRFMSKTQNKRKPDPSVPFGHKTMEMKWPPQSFAHPGGTFRH